MKIRFATFPLALLLAVAPALAVAQTAPAAKNTVKKRGGKVVPRTTEEKTPVDDDPATKLSEADLEIAKRVITGEIPCELGATVHVTPHKREGFFIVRTGIQRFLMHPVESRTGAIRLEDPAAGAMWLQLSNKSMLMSQKVGKRLADDCMNPAQSALNESLKKNPINILEAAPVAPAASAASAASATPATPPASFASPVTVAAPLAANPSGGVAPAASAAPAAPAASATPAR